MNFMSAKVRAFDYYVIPITIIVIDTCIDCNHKLPALG